MNILICSDSFKDSLASSEVSYIIREVLLKKFPKAEINIVMLADGGEGSLIALNTAVGGEVISHSTFDSLLRPIKASFLHYEKDNHAVIELAQTCGLTMLDISERNCFNTSTYGLGMQIQKAMELRVNSIDLLIGGSSTNDLGVGMAAVLTHEFFTDNDLIKFPRGRDMISVSKISSSHDDIKGVTFKVVTDVNNILLGTNGAAYTYGKQKGANESELNELEAGAKNIVALVSKKDTSDYHLREGAGAAGGVGYGAMAFLGATKESGIDYMIDRLDLAQKMMQADLVITGEGKMDDQTINGKLVSGICKLARSRNKDVISVCAINELSKIDSENLGLKATYAMYDWPPNQISKSDSEVRLRKITAQIIDEQLT